MHAAEIRLEIYTIHDAINVCIIESTLKTIYLTAFEQVYQNYWTEQFAQSFVNYFDNHIKKLKQSDDLRLVVAKKNDRITGWMLFSCQDKLVIINILCVDPEFQKNGIGKALIFSIKEYVPDVKSIAVVTKRVNTISPLFYERLGFVKTDFLYSDYRSDEVQGYELDIESVNFNNISYVKQALEIFKDCKQRTIELRRIIDGQLFAQAAPIFTAALLKAYEKISAEDLKLDKDITLQERLDCYFQNKELCPFNEKKFFVVGAFFEDNLIGYISFDKPTESGELYLRQLVVNTDYWQSGIGKKLVSTTLKLFPSTTCLALVTRRKNEYSRIFYKHLAFDECEDYVHAPWDPKDFIGYKKVITPSQSEGA